MKSYQEWINEHNTVPEQPDGIRFFRGAIAVVFIMTFVAKDFSIWIALFGILCVLLDTVIVLMKDWYV